MGCLGPSHIHYHSFISSHIITHHLIIHHITIIYISYSLHFQPSHIYHVRWHSHIIPSSSILNSLSLQSLEGVVDITQFDRGIHTSLRPLLQFLLGGAARHHTIVSSNMMWGMYTLIFIVNLHSLTQASWDRGGDVSYHSFSFIMVLLYTYTSYSLHFQPSPLFHVRLHSHIIASSYTFISHRPHFQASSYYM